MSDKKDKKVDGQKIVGLSDQKLNETKAETRIRSPLFGRDRLSKVTNPGRDGLSQDSSKVPLDEKTNLSHKPMKFRDTDIPFYKKLIRYSYISSAVVAFLFVVSFVRNHTEDFTLESIKHSMESVYKKSVDYIVDYRVGKQSKDLKNDRFASMLRYNPNPKFQIKDGDSCGNLLRVPKGKRRKLSSAKKRILDAVSCYLSRRDPVRANKILTKINFNTFSRWSPVDLNLYIMSLRVWVMLWNPQKAIRISMRHCESLTASPLCLGRLVALAGGAEFREGEKAFKFLRVVSRKWPDYLRCKIMIYGGIVAMKSGNLIEAEKRLSSARRYGSDYVDLQRIHDLRGLNNSQYLKENKSKNLSVNHLNPDIEQSLRGYKRVKFIQELGKNRYREELKNFLRKPFPYKGTWTDPLIFPLISERAFQGNLIEPYSKWLLLLENEWFKVNRINTMDRHYTILTWRLRLAFAQDRHREQRKVLDLMDQSFVNASQSLHYRAISLMQKKKSKAVVSRASKLFFRAWKKNGRWESIYGYGLASLVSSNNKGFKFSLKELRKKKNKFARSWRRELVARSLIQVGDFDKANKLLNKVVNENPHFVAGWVLLRKIAKKTNNSKEVSRLTDVMSKKRLLLNNWSFRENLFSPFGPLALM